MPGKVQAYVEMANETAASITQDAEAWMQFLRHSARFYKYSFNDQLLIYAQRPEATACASYEIWNNTMHRYIRRGSRGIALLSPTDNGMQLRYVFDVADTGELLHSRPVEIWRMEDRHTNAVNTALDNAFSPLGMNNLRDRLKMISLESAANYLDSHLKDIVDSVAGSSLSGYDEAEVGRSFLNTAMFSISYILQTRCGMEPDVSTDSLQEIRGWNTPGAVGQLGDAVTQMSKQILRQIEIAIKDFERGVVYDAAELQAERRLPDPGDGLDRAGAEAPGQVRDDAPEVPGGESLGSIHEDDSERDADGAPAGDRIDSSDEAGDDHGEPEETERSDRGSEGDEPDGLGGSDEFPEESGGRDDLLGTDLRLTPRTEQLSLFPSEAEQIRTLDARLIHRPIGTERSDRPVLHLSDEEIEHVLRRGSGFEGGKLRIAALYAQNPTPVDARVFLSNEYGVGGHSHTFLDGTSGFIDYNSRGMQFRRWKTNEEYTLRWHAVERYIRNMMEQGTYLTPKEQQRFAEMQSAFLDAEMPLPQPRMHYPPVEPETLTQGYRSTNGIITQMDIERTLREWNGHIEGKHAMTRFVQEGHSTEEIAERLRAEFGGDLSSLPVMVNDVQREVPWTDAANALNRLVWDNQFYTEEEQEHLNDSDPVAVREDLTGDSIANDEVADPEALENTPVVQQTETNAETITSEAEKTVESTIPPLRPGESRIPEHDGIPAMRQIVVDLTPREQEPPVFSYDLHPGDTVYLGDQAFVVENVGLFDVSFRDPSQAYPVLRAESKEMLQRLLGLDVRNDVYRPGFWPQTPEAVPDVQPVVPVSGENFHITDDHLGEGGQKAKYAYNIAAIRTLKTIEAENRGATAEEQEILSRYVGWGGIPQAFDEDNENWGNEYIELKELLTKDEYDMACSSTLNAHYTSPTVIRAMYQALEQMGFRTGNILEPSCGVGNFFGMLPESMRNSNLYGVELDSVTGRIASLLYPKADITIAGFETTDRKDFFDVAIGNVPFGAYKVPDKAFDRYNFLIHDYFFAKALDQVRPGGVIAFITSKGTMDKQSPEVRKYIAQRAELLGAIRLPNTAFSANANTYVTSDIIFLQKRDRVIDIEPDWVHLGKNPDGITINSYFVDHPEMVLGQMMKWDLLDRNPAVLAEVPKHVTKRREIWDLQTLAHVNEVCPDNRLKLCINLSFSCSLRIGELLGLTWDCVDVSEESIKEERSYIYVNKELQRASKDALIELENKGVIKEFPEKMPNTKTVLVLKTPKTPSSVRKIYLPSSVAEMLIQWKKDQDEVKEALGGEYYDFDLVIASPMGTPVEHGQIEKSFKDFIKHYELPAVVFHSLRHSSITYKLKLTGGDIKAVQGDSGHSQAQMVTDQYSHILDESRKENARLLENAFYRASGSDPRKKEGTKESANTNTEPDPEVVKQILSDPDMLQLLMKLSKTLGK